MSASDLSQAPEGSGSYRIAIEPVEGRARVAVGGLTIAQSVRALALRETHFPRHIYFPKADLVDGILSPSDFRTFCPFKGTATYWHLTLPGRMVENGAWSYENPLHEALPVGGFVAFDRRAIPGLRMEPPVGDDVTNLPGDHPLVDWVARDAWQCETPSLLTERFARRLVDIGVPLWRLTVDLWTLHPEIVGKRYLWFRGTDGVAESDTQYGILQSPAYRDSPVRLVSEGLGGVRQRLDAASPEFHFPILSELQANGGTDYVAMPLPFSDGRFQTMTLATNHPAGFRTAELGQVFEVFGMLGRLYEVLTLRREATVLFDAYLGQRTGRQVLAGLTRRGAGQVIRAAIVYCDLRNSSRMAETLSRKRYLDLLNGFFERVCDPVLAEGGEVLKFIGDAVLAIFPLDGDAANDAGSACAKARRAAEAILAEIADMPRSREDPAVKCAIGVHFGDVMYGNVGSPRRLDFTVTGQAANVAARLSTLCKEMDRTVLFSAEVARHAGEGLRSLGTHELRNLPGTHEVFDVADGEGRPPTDR